MFVIGSFFSFSAAALRHTHTRARREIGHDFEVGHVLAVPLPPSPPPPPKLKVSRANDDEEEEEEEEKKKKKNGGDGGNGSARAIVSDSTAYCLTFDGRIGTAAAIDTIAGRHHFGWSLPSACQRRPFAVRIGRL